jgi:hypothetical protein
MISFLNQIAHVVNDIFVLTDLPFWQKIFRMFSALVARKFDRNLKRNSSQCIII